MAVDWTQVRVRPGQWVCPEHGAVQPWRQLVPACPDCLRDLHQAVLTSTGALVYQAQDSARCAGSEQHSLAAGQVRRSWSSCRCTALGGHHTWACRTCGNRQSWPPHSVVDATPYAGPGAHDTLPG